MSTSIQQNIIKFKEQLMKSRSFP